MNWHRCSIFAAAVVVGVAVAAVFEAAQDSCWRVEMESYSDLVDAVLTIETFSPDTCPSVDRSMLIGRAKETVWMRRKQGVGCTQMIDWSSYGFPEHRENYPWKETQTWQRLRIEWKTDIDWVCRGCFNCSSMEMKSNEGPAELLFDVLGGSGSAVVGLVVRRISWIVLLFKCSSLTEREGDGMEVGECKVDDGWRRPRLLTGLLVRLKASEGRSSISPRIVVDDWRSRSSISRPSWELFDWEWWWEGAGNFVATAALTAANAAAWAKKNTQVSYETWLRIVFT